MRRRAPYRVRLLGNPELGDRVVQVDPDRDGLPPRTVKLPYRREIDVRELGPDEPVSQMEPEILLFDLDVTSAASDVPIYRYRPKPHVEGIL